MRVISGQLKGRRLTAPSAAHGHGQTIRPTSDRARETLFNLLVNSIGLELDGARVADLFAGTGALAIEALSRGAAHAVLVDNTATSLDLARRNVTDLGLDKVAKILRADSRNLPTASDSFDVLFLDPPYHKDLIAPTLQSLVSKGWIKSGSVVVIECAADEDPVIGDNYEIDKDRIIGDTRLIIATAV